MPEKTSMMKKSIPWCFSDNTQWLGLIHHFRKNHRGLESEIDTGFGRIIIVYRNGFQASKKENYQNCPSIST
jgi:hypothetical protein